MRQALIALALCAAATGAAAASDLGYEPGNCELAADGGWCRQSAKDMARDWPKALRGDYQAQRNVAYCLSGGCDGAVAVNRIQGCAWRIVIVSSGSPKVGATDTANLRADCGRLEPTEKTAAAMRADALFPKVYGRPLR